MTRGIPTKNAYIHAKEIHEVRRRENRIEEMKKFYKSIPKNIRGYNIGDLLQKDSHYTNISPMGKNSLKKYLNNPTLFLLFSGASGVGKSSVAVAVALELMRRDFGLDAKYVDVSTLLNEFSFGRKDASQVEVLEEVKRPDILILDDIGAGAALNTATRQNSMQSLISSRWENDKITILTTNLAVGRGEDDDPESIQGWFGHSAWDRIAGNATSGNANLTRIVFKGETLRGQKSRSTKKVHQYSRSSKGTIIDKNK